MAKSELRKQPVGVPAPLVPAITRYDKSIEEIARDKARPELEESMEAVRNVALRVYHDAFGACEAIKPHILDPGTDPAILARAIRERPDQFGPLRGKSGILGRRQGKKAGPALRRIGQQRLSGTPPEAGYGIWKTSTARKHGNGKSRDIVEVPALSCAQRGDPHSP
ncbi:hypothetical protein [Agrobacterium radiobacter]|uniref:hypothetical protein n=1 Tax=Agrobacterium radiobacter TaxID=362 RepID=UPI003CE55CA1